MPQLRVRSNFTTLKWVGSVANAAEWHSPSVEKKERLVSEAVFPHVHQWLHFSVCERFLFVWRRRDLRFVCDVSGFDQGTSRRVWSWSDGSLCLGNKLHLSLLMGLYFPLIKERNWEQFLVATSSSSPASDHASPAFGIWVCGLGSFMRERMIGNGFLILCNGQTVETFFFPNLFFCCSVKLFNCET